MRKKVGLLLAIEPTWGGAFQYDLAILDAALRLPQDEFEIVVGYSHKSWLTYLDRYVVKKVSVPLGYWARFFGQLLHCSGTSVAVWRTVAPFFHPTVRAILHEQCDLWIFPSQDPWCYLAPVPALATIHDLMHRYERRFPEIGTKWQYAWREWHFKNTCSWSTGILVDSRLGKQHVVDSYQADPSRLHILPFIAPSYLEGEKESSSDGESLLRLPKKFLFYPAQFWEHKNHKRLVNALNLLKPHFPDMKLVLAGAKKNEYAALQDLVEQLGLLEDILFLGYVPDNQMGFLYKRARAMIMPTFSGPTNIPPLEAMKSGCPSAVSKIYAMPEQTNGAALLFDPESVDEIASAMAALWEDDELCNTLAERGKVVSDAWAKVHFDSCFESIVWEVLSRVKTTST